MLLSCFYFIDLISKIMKNVQLHTELSSFYHRNQHDICQNWPIAFNPYRTTEFEVVDNVEIINRFTNIKGNCHRF
jgi:hypothetical protein